MSETPPEPTRREDVAALFAASRLEMSEGLRARTHEVASRVFGLAPAEGPLVAGDTLGPYRIARILGRGGQAFVYEAEHEQIGRRVALKVPQADVAERLLNEARLAVRLDHPHIVRVEDVGEGQGPTGVLPYLVMEYLPGGSLAERLATAPEGLPLSEVVAISRAILLALREAHAQGIVHRDVKPGNVLFDAEGRAKLSDLGIGTLATGSADLAHSIERSQLTQGAIGTPAYMAPEQEHPERLNGARIDGRADLFSFGKLLFACLTGATPTTIRPPSRLRPELDPGWDELVFHCLEEERERRPQSADELLEALARLPLGGTTPPPLPAPAVTVRPRPRTPAPAAPSHPPARRASLPPKPSAPGLIFAALAAFLLGLAFVLARLKGHVVYALPLGGYAAGCALLLAWFARSERRALVSVGVPGALLLAAPLVAWEPFLALMASDSHRIHTYARGLTHSLGVPALVLGLVLGLALSLRARRQERRAREGDATESFGGAAFLTCLQLSGCLVLTVAIGVLGVAFCLALLR